MSEDNNGKGSGTSMGQTTANDLLLRPKHTRPRRTSSVGKIDMGDTIPGLATMTTSRQAKVASKRRLDRLSDSKTHLLQKFWLSFREMNYRHAWIAPLIILISVYSAYFTSGNMTESNPIHMFVDASYQIPGTNEYGKGVKDLCFVFYYMIFFTFFREFLLDVVIRPLPNLLGAKEKSKRIMEQTFYVIYYSLSSPFGLYIMYHSDLWFFKTKPMYETYPDLTNPYLFKIFYLGQAAFWAQQACVLVLQLEKPRKDYKEMIYHHIVTLLLVWSSYVFHFTKMGLPIYITMDISDLLFALSKDVNYIDSPVTPYIFSIFVCSWVYLRHYINIKILWSVVTEFRTVGEYRLNFAVQQYKCWISLPIVFTLIAALQLVQIYWFSLIVKVLYRILTMSNYVDIRSDGEDNNDTESESISESSFNEDELDTKSIAQESQE
ncbi:ceramide synthase Lac1p [Monosporozyma unispora]